MPDMTDVSISDICVKLCVHLYFRSFMLYTYIMKKKKEVKVERKKFNSMVLLPLVMKHVPLEMTSVNAIHKLLCSMFDLSARDIQGKLEC